MAILGYSSIGGTQFFWLQWFSIKVQADEDGTFDDLNAYFNLTGSGNYKLCIWADNGSGEPGTLLFESSPDTVGTSPSLKTVSCNYSFTNGEILHLGIIADDWFELYGDTGSTNQFTDFVEDYTDWAGGAPNPPTVNGQYNTVVTIYGNYTPAAAPTETRFIFAPIGGTYIGAPMLEVSGDVEVTPSAISVEMNVISPAVTGDSNTAPSVISTELNVISPIVTADVDVIPTTISNELNVIDPVVTGDSDFTPVVISSVINVISPVVSGDSNIEVSVISATLNVISPTVTSEIEVLASVIEAELNSISPVVTGDAETIPSVISLEMNSISPLVSGDSNVSVSKISTNLSVISPIVFSDVDIAAESINVSLNINSPSVIGDSDTDVNVISAELGVISPLVIGDSNTNISTISALLNVLIPIVTNGETTYYAALRYWNGSSYQKGVVRVRINGVWVRKQIRLRLDNEWKLIDCNG